MAQSFTNQQTIYADITQNSTAANLTRQAYLANIEQRYLLQKYFNNEGSYTQATVANQQFYKTPPNYSKSKTVTVTVGNLQWTLTEILTRQEWDKLNVFPYYSDIPVNYFIYPGGDHGGRVGIWPIPSSDGNTITFNYKFRIPDLSMADDTTGTVAVSNGGTTITGSGTNWVPTTNSQLESRWIKIAQNKGDNLWYQIATVNTTTSLTLYQPYQGITVSGGSFVIGQMPILNEDFHDMLIWKPIIFYFSSIVDNKVKRTEFQAMYDEKLHLLDQYEGQKTVDVNLGRRPTYRNPNLYYQGT